MRSDWFFLVAAFLLLVGANRVVLKTTAQGSDGVGGLAAARSESEQKLSQGREALRGMEKNLPLARDILTDLAEHHAAKLKPVDRCHLYVYLGYIEDLSGNREAAVNWYRKAIPIEGPQTEGIRKAAEIGISRPVTRLRHLDGPQRARPRRRGTERPVEHIGKGYITYEARPELGKLQMDLSLAERLENFEILSEAIDRTYSFFEHKEIGWQEIVERYRPKVRTAETGDEYYRVLHDFVRELKDAHSSLLNAKHLVQLPRFSPDVATGRIEGMAVVTYVTKGSEAFEKGVRPGSVITRVDGLTVAEKIEQLRPMLYMPSSERNFLENAHQRLLHGVEDSKVTVAFVPRGEKSQIEIELRRSRQRGQKLLAPGFPVDKGKFVWSGTHPSGCGYIRIVSFHGRQEIADEFDRALEKMEQTPALIVDVRDNPGGYGTSQSRIIGRFITAPTTAGLSFIKNGPGHDDFSRHEARVKPTGAWQYTKPLALLMNSVTGSASDAFVCRMIGTGRPVTVGATTHGNQAGWAAHVVLPCGLVVRVSRGYTCDVKGRIIERNGNVPQIQAELNIDDILNGTDSVIDRAAQELSKLQLDG